MKYTIVGGGIAGLTTAIALNKIGIRATVFEAAYDIKPLGAGLVLAANVVKAYQQLVEFGENRSIEPSLAGRFAQCAAPVGA